MASLVYEPLNGDEFRLLTLLAGSDGPVRCRLRTVRFGEVSFHQEGIYLWDKKEAIEIKSETRIRLSSIRLSRFLTGSWGMLDPICTMRMRVAGSRGTETGSVTVTFTRGADKAHRTHVGGRFYMAIQGATTPIGDEEAIEWNKDDVPIVPEYEALSYAWGDPTPTATIIVNGCEVEVRQNLHAALLQLRMKSKIRDVWVDALCIDQQNLEERAMQVVRMPSIYQRASRVIAWLGPAGSTSQVAFKLLAKLGQNQPPKKPRWYQYREWLGPQFEYWQGVGGGPKYDWFIRPRAKKGSRLEFLRRLNDPKKIDSRGRQALEDMLTTPYWKRAWIIQELAYARNLSLVCGSLSLDWNVFQVAITGDHCDLFSNREHNKHQESDHWFCEFVENSGIAFIQNNRRRTRLPYRAHGFELRSATLLRTLESAWGFQSTDPRDRIYALLGLPSLDDDMPLPPPDYSKPVSHVYCTVAKAMIRYERALSILCLHHSSEGPHPLGLPSWVPDWTKRSNESPLMMDVFPSRPRYCAAGLTCVEGPDWEDFGDGRRVDIWANSLGMGSVTQKDLFQMKYLNKRRGVTAEPHPPTREERIEEYDDTVWQLRGQFFGGKDGLTARKYEEIPSLEPADPYKLVVDGFAISSIVSNYRPVTFDSVATGEWRDIIREWEGVDEKYLASTDKISRPLPPLAHFLWIIIKGHFRKISEEDEQNWLTIFYEKYLIWIGRLDIDSARYARGHHLVDDVERVLERTVGWKLAVSNEAHVAMVPARACQGDLICILFGADVPIVLRERAQSSSEPSYEFLGQAYVHNMMFGEALNGFRHGRYTRLTFTIT